MSVERRGERSAVEAEARCAAVGLFAWWVDGSGELFSEAPWTDLVRSRGFLGIFIGGKLANLSTQRGASSGCGIEFPPEFMGRSER